MSEKQHTVFIALGSNLGNKNRNLEIALEEIAHQIGLITAISSIYETEPWGYQSLNSFLNMVIQVETILSPIRILHITQDIEKKMGRSEKTSESYQDRLIDIDLILFGDSIINSAELTIPHPRFHERQFVLQPLCEIAPDLIHPILGKTIRKIWSDFS